MPSMNTKNMMLSPAAMDLGLGASLQVGVENSVEEQRKKLLLKKKQMSLYSPAGISLLGNPGAGDGP